MTSVTQVRQTAWISDQRSGIQAVCFFMSGHVMQQVPSRGSVARVVSSNQQRLVVAFQTGPLLLDWSHARKPEVDALRFDRIVGAKGTRYARFFWRIPCFVTSLRSSWA
jgi:hypothetical protein